MFYLQQDLVLSHYDAKAHLVVARRIFDSLTPGWRQVGGVWLPLPHLIQALPTQIDLFYRTGAFGSWLSIGSLAVTVWAFARLVLTVTGSHLGAVTAAFLLVANPNLIYLHVTPMTEPLLLAASALVILWIYEWIDRGSRTRDWGPVPIGLQCALFAATWTRYEAWAVIAAAVAAAACASWRSGAAPATIARRVGQLAVWPATAVVLFLANSRLATGDWFVSGGFYVPDPVYQRHVLKDLIGVWWGTHRLSGYVTETVALVCATGLAAQALRRRRDAALLVPIALLAAAALPFYAMFEGHPYRIRYMVPVVAACALLCGLAAGRMRGRGRMALAAALVVSALIESPPWNQRAPLLEEAQWDVPVSLERRAVRACLATDYRGERVLASMGSLAHVMQELSHEGLAIADFVHEGNGDLWAAALEQGPARYAGWMLVEEESEGGDALAARIRRDASFTRDMRRVCDGGGVALYRRTI
jgi:hypothetical protein